MSDAPRHDESIRPGSCNTLWQRAASFAAKAHRHQVRKDGVTPYVSHVFRVVFTLRHLFGCADETTLAAALLHDVIEDCDVDYDEVAEHFGSEVADLVAALTKDMRLPENAREGAYDEQLAAAGPAARLIKLADVYDNLSDLSPGDGETRRKMLDKARRAVDLARKDHALKDACAAVEAMIGRVSHGA